MAVRIPTFVVIAACAIAGSVQAQELGDRSVRIALPGITFTRALNGAADGAVVSGSALTLRSAAKRDNFRGPDGKLSNNTAPVLLAEVDNGKPFTLTARVAPRFVDTYDASAL